MSLRTLLILTTTFSLSLAAHAQDKIYMTNGEVMDTKIKSVGVKTITYLRFSNQAGPEYTVIKNDVDKIVYQNGTTDVFDHMRMPHHRMPKEKAAEGGVKEKQPYRPNIIGLAPIQFTDNGIGLSLSYERSLDANGIVTFYLPVIATWNTSNNNYNNGYNPGYNHQDKMFYIMPGVKIYPTGSYGMVRYAIGPSIVLASGDKTQTSYDQLGNAYTTTQDHVELGIVINNSLNINPSPHIYLGLELGLGFTYLNQLSGISQGTTEIAQGSFKIGYRF